MESSSVPQHVGGPIEQDTASSSSVAAAAATAPSHHSLSYAYQTYLRHDTEEQNHWDDVCRSYRQYAAFAMQQWANHQYRLHSLPESQRRYLPAALKQETAAFGTRAAAYKDAAIRNQFCLDCILRHAGQAHSQQQATAESETAAGRNMSAFSTDAQMSKVSSVLKSLARDWSADGKPERDMAYKPILQRVKQYLPLPLPQQGEDQQEGTASTVPRICVPGRYSVLSWWF